MAVQGTTDSMDEVRKKREEKSVKEEPARRLSLDDTRKKREEKSHHEEPPRRLTLEETRNKREEKKPAEEPVKRMDLRQTKSQRESRKKKDSHFPVVGNQYFIVYFGATRIGFSKVNNIRQKAEYEELVEGGLNGYVHILNKPNSRGETLTLEKGVSARKDLTELMQQLSPGVRINIPVTITLYYRDEEDWKPVRSWGFDDGVVSGWEVNEFSALGSDVVIEKIEITHAGLMEIGV